MSIRMGGLGSRMPTLETMEEFSVIVPRPLPVLTWMHSIAKNDILTSGSMLNHLHILYPFNQVLIMSVYTLPKYTTRQREIVYLKFG